MIPPRRWWRRVPLAVGIGLSLLASAAWLPGPAAAATPGPIFYLDVGGSASVGFQPTDAMPRGQPTDAGYANDLVNQERAVWPTLRLAEIGCPGATTATMLQGGGHCSYPDGTQLAAAVDFLHSHPTTVLVTVDLGFNNLRSCLLNRPVDGACVDGSVDLIHHQLPQILTALRAAGSPGLRIVGIGHFDPYLEAYLHGPAGRARASATLEAVSQLDQTLRLVYASYGIPMADVAASFQTASSDSTLMRGVGVVPDNVARTCALTWMCAPAPYGPNQHPNDEGYRLISQAIKVALAGG